MSHTELSEDSENVINNKLLYCGAAECLLNVTDTLAATLCFCSCYPFVIHHPSTNTALHFPLFTSKRQRSFSDIGAVSPVGIPWSEHITGSDSLALKRIIKYTYITSAMKTVCAIVEQIFNFDKVHMLFLLLFLELSLPPCIFCFVSEFLFYLKTRFTHHLMNLVCSFRLFHAKICFYYSAPCYK